MFLAAFGLMTRASDSISAVVGQQLIDGVQYRLAKAMPTKSEINNEGNAMTHRVANPDVRNFAMQLISESAQERIFFSG